MNGWMIQKWYQSKRRRKQETRTMDTEADGQWYGSDYLNQIPKDSSFLRKVYRERYLPWREYWRESYWRISNQEFEVMLQNSYFSSSTHLFKSNYDFIRGRISLPLWPTSRQYLFERNISYALLEIIRKYHFKFWSSKWSSKVEIILKTLKVLLKILSTAFETIKNWEW